MTLARRLSDLLAYLGVRVEPIVVRLWSMRETVLLENWCLRLIQGKHLKKTPKLLKWLAERDQAAAWLIQRQVPRV